MASNNSSKEFLYLQQQLFQAAQQQQPRLPHHLQSGFQNQQRYYGSQQQQQNCYGSPVYAPVTSPSASISSPPDNDASSNAENQTQQEQQETFNTDDFNQQEDSFISQSRNMLSNMIQERNNSNQTTFDSEMFIDLVKSYPCLWNVTLNVHKDINKRKTAWNQITEVFGGKYSGT